MIRRLVACTVALAVIALAAGCSSVTRGAVRNEAANTLHVALKSPDGEQEIRFDNVAPNTTTAFEELPFDERLRGLIVEVLTGTAEGGTVDLEETHDNVIVVRDDAPPAVESQENPDNTFW